MILITKNSPRKDSPGSQMQKNLRHRIEVEVLVCVGWFWFFFPKGRSGAPRWCKLFGSSKCWDYLGIDSLTEKKFSEKNSHHWFVHPTLEIIQVRSTLPKSGRDIRWLYLKCIYIYIFPCLKRKQDAHHTQDHHVYVFVFVVFISSPWFCFFYRIYLPSLSPLRSWFERLRWHLYAELGLSGHCWVQGHPVNENIGGDGSPVNRWRSLGL